MSLTSVRPILFAAYASFAATAAAPSASEAASGFSLPTFQFKSVQGVMPSAELSAFQQALTDVGALGITGIPHFADARSARSKEPFCARIFCLACYMPLHYLRHASPLPSVRPCQRMRSAHGVCGQ